MSQCASQCNAATAGVEWRRFLEVCGRVAVALASCAPQCEPSSIMLGSECDGTSSVHVSDPGNGETLIGPESQASSV